MALSTDPSGGGSERDNESTDSTDTSGDTSTSTRETADSTSTPARGGDTGDPSSGGNFTDDGRDDSSDPFDDRDNEDADTGGTGGGSSDSDSDSGFNDTPARGGDTGDPSSGGNFTDDGGDGDTGGSTGSRETADGATGGDGTVARGGNTGDPSSGVNFTDTRDTTSPQPSQERDTDGGPVGEQPQSREGARRQALESEYGEDAQITRVGEGAFQVRVPGEGRPQSGQAVDRASDTDGETTIVAFGDEGQQTIENLQEYSDVGRAIQEQARDAAIIEAAESQHEQRSQGQEDIATGNLGDSQEIQDEQAAEQVSEQLGVPVTDEDVTVREGEDGQRQVELTDEAQRAAALASSAEFLRRDAEVTREGGQFAVELPGDSDAMEEALTQKIRTGEAFGGETTISAFGQTLNLDEATQDFADMVADGASAVGDAIDQANLLSGAPPFTGSGGDSQELTTASSTAEAGENFVIQSLEGGAAAVGDAPRGLLELGEAAADPTAYQVGAEASMMGARRLDALTDPDAIESGVSGTVGTAERVDELAQSNPEAAAGVGASVIGGAAVAGGLYTATPAALSRVASVSPTGARAIAATLDPLRTSGRAAASTARRASIPDSDSLRLGQFREDTRAMAQLTGRQRTGGDSDATSGSQQDAGQTTGGDFEPSRDYILEGGTQQRARMDLVDQQQSDLEAARGDYEGEADAFAEGREATFDPDEDVMEPEEILQAASRSEADAGGTGARSRGQQTSQTESRVIREQAEAREVTETQDVLEQARQLEVADTLEDAEDAASGAVRRQEAGQRPTVQETEFESVTGEFEDEFAGPDSSDGTAVFDDATVDEDADIFDDTDINVQEGVTEDPEETVLEAEQAADVTAEEAVSETVTETETVSELGEPSTFESELESESESRLRAQPDLEDEDEEDEPAEEMLGVTFDSNTFDSGIADVDDLANRMDEANEQSDPAADVENELPEF